MLKKPGQFGFKREVVQRKNKTTLDDMGNVVEEKPKFDIYYYSPTGKKLRSPKEVEKYLSENQPEAEGLSLRNFSFRRKELGLGEFEKVRQAGSPRENKTKKKEASRNKLPEDAEIREKETSDSGNRKIKIHISCKELNRKTQVSVKGGKHLGSLMSKFSELAGMKGPDQLVFLCEGKKLDPSDRVDNLASREIVVELAERGN